jgi:hypothetical protein
MSMSAYGGFPSTASVVEASGVEASGRPLASTGAIATGICGLLTASHRTTSVRLPETPAVKVCATHSFAESGVHPVYRHAEAREGLL